MSTSIIRRRLSRTTIADSAAPAAAATAPHLASAAVRLPIVALTLVLAAGGSMLLTRGALAAVTTAAWWRPDDAVAATLMGIGALISAWYALTALALLASTLPHVNLGVRRWGAPLLRTLGVSAGSITLALSAPSIVTAAEFLPAAVSEDPAWSQDEGLGMAWTGEESRTIPEALVRDPSAADLLSTAPSHPVIVMGMPATPVATESDATAVTQVPEAAPDQVPEAAPADATSVAPAPGPAPAPAPAPAEAHPTPEPAPAPAHITPEVPAPSSSHIVSRGESVWRIAAAENPGASNAWIAARVAQYVAANPALVPNPDLIFPGQELAIPEVQP